MTLTKLHLGEEVKGLSFMDKLIHVLDNGELDYWEDRRDPPNLTADEFKLEGKYEWPSRCNR